MKLKLAVLMFAIVGAIILVVECCSLPAKPVADVANAYTGNASCQSCHQQEHAQWLTSHHFMAMQPANDSTVLGNFNDAVFTADGVTSRFFKKNGKFFINTQSETGANVDYEVKYIFGFTPLQQYLVEFAGGHMQVPRVSWDTKAKKWFHQYAGDKIPAGDWLHWTGNAQNWNTMCASCHSTNVQKGYNPETDTYHTTYNDINVSCESCHGPGKNHIDYINGEEYKKGHKKPGSLLMLYKEQGQMAEVNMCGYCHARRVDLTGNVLPGNELMQDLIAELPTTEFFYADGQMNDEDYNYTSFLQSKMFHRGVKCTNCHNPHSGKLRNEGPLVCAQCHNQQQYEAPSHTLHAVNTTGVNCVTCHMPSKMYMGNDLRHDHSFRIPRPDLTAKYGTPNTCNACHKDKSAQWAADEIAKGYGKPPAYHFSEDLIPGSRLDAGSVAHLGRLMGDTGAPDIVRAAAVRYYSQISSIQRGATLLAYLTDTSAMVRYASTRALAGLPSSNWKDAVAPLLADPVRAVRIAAADLFVGLPSSELPAGNYEAYTKAKQELDKFTLYPTDFAMGNLQAGDYYRRQNDLAMAEKFYRRAVAKDSQMVNARVNLASTLNATGRNQEALAQLVQASRIQPQNDHVFYTMGLLYAEMKNLPAAEEALKKAFTINKYNIRSQYNYGLLLQQSGKAAAAEKVYLAALKTEPQNGDLLNAITILNMQQGNVQKAMEMGRLLKQYHGNNAGYAQLLRQLGL
jgi:predicted CXXCH cytochrome family protein